MAWQIAAGLAASAIVGALSSRSAAKKQAESAEASQELQKEMFDISREDSLPWLNVGRGALYTLSDVYGLGARSQQPMVRNPTPAAPAPALPTDTSAIVEAMTPDLTGVDVYAYARKDPDLRLMVDWAAHRDRTLTYADREKLKTMVRAKMVEKNLAKLEKTQTGAPAQAPVAANPAPAAPQAPQNVNAPAQPGFQEFFASPDYQFRAREGEKALLRNASARGMLGSGALSKDLLAYSQGLASTEYGNWFNRLAGLAGYGQNTASTTGNQAINSGQSQGQALVDAGTARASGYVGMSNAISQGVSNYYGLKAMGAFQ